MKRAVENLQRILQLLERPAREPQDLPEDVYAQSARNYVLEASALLAQHADSAEIRTSVVELLLKAELALASVDVSRAGLGLRLADELLLEARMRLEALNTDDR
jgi:hypothetical protein